MANGLTQPPVVSGLRHPGSLEYLGFSPKCLKVVLLYGAEGESVKEEEEEEEPLQRFRCV